MEVILNTDVMYLVKNILPNLVYWTKGSVLE